MQTPKFERVESEAAAELGVEIVKGAKMLYAGPSGSFGPSDVNERLAADCASCFETKEALARAQAAELIERLGKLNRHQRRSIIARARKQARGQK